jgi:hydroxymethylglutaryl-CoA lyase
MNNKIKITEVGPRDGLQNEKKVISTLDKKKFIELLLESGLEHIEITSFVRPDKIPALADAEELSSLLDVPKFPNFSCLVPNLKGYEKARKFGYKKIAIFGAASETFSQKNINMSIRESLNSFREVCNLAQQDGISVRAYISTVIACPYEGKIFPQKVLEVVEQMVELEVYEISLGDTIGVGVPKDVERLLEVLLKNYPPSLFAVHFHDTYGTALANVQKAYELGIRSFDSSAGGLGGCPYAPNSAGNLATEDLVYLLENSGISTNVNLKKLLCATSFINHVIGRNSISKVYLAKNKN